MTCTECGGEIGELLQVGDRLYAVCSDCGVAHAHGEAQADQSPTEAAEALVRLSELRVAGTRLVGLQVDQESDEKGEVTLQIRLSEEARKALAADRDAVVEILSGQRQVTENDRARVAEAQKRVRSASHPLNQIEAAMLAAGASARLGAERLRHRENGGWYSSDEIQRIKATLERVGVKSWHAAALLSQEADDEAA